MVAKIKNIPFWVSNIVTAVLTFFISGKINQSGLKISVW